MMGPNSSQLAPLNRVICVCLIGAKSRDLLNILDKIGKSGAHFKSQRETWADTTTPAGA